jgi:hypothetical protein
MFTVGLRYWFLCTVEVAVCSEALVAVWQATRRHILKDRNIIALCPENTKSHKLSCFLRIDSAETIWKSNRKVHLI